MGTHVQDHGFGSGFNPCHRWLSLTVGDRVGGSGSALTLPSGAKGVAEGSLICLTIVSNIIGNSQCPGSRGLAIAAFGLKRMGAGGNHEDTKGTKYHKGNANMTFSHVPVLAQALVMGVGVRPGGLYLDATVGGGGHSGLILAQGRETRVVAIDRDPLAIAAAQAALADYGDRVQFWQGNFADYFQTLGPAPALGKFDGIIADLGVSSAQFDTPERGFSFRHEAPLDMRMDPRQVLTAADIINTYDERALADLFFTYGEERLSRRIARRIVAQRPFHSTTALANTIAHCYPAATRARGKAIHPATRVFQALRIAVNQELRALEMFLAQAPAWLTPGGRIGIISFHSLEDRLVKHRLRESEILTVITKKPIVPEPEEVAENPRARSAKLRLAERSAGMPA